MNAQQSIQFLELFALSLGVTPVLGTTLNGAPQVVQSGQVKFQLCKQSLQGYANGTYEGIDLLGTGPNGMDYAIGLNLQSNVNKGKITFGRPK